MSNNCLVSAWNSCFVAKEPVFSGAAEAAVEQRAEAKTGEKARGSRFNFRL
jgi:hypothetical protein